MSNKLRGLLSLVFWILISQSLSSHFLNELDDNEKTYQYTKSNLGNHKQDKKPPELLDFMNMKNN